MTIYVLRIIFDPELFLCHLRCDNNFYLFFTLSAEKKQRVVMICPVGNKER